MTQNSRDPSLTMQKFIGCFRTILTALKEPALLRRAGLCLAAFVAVIASGAWLASSSATLTSATTSMGGHRCVTVPWLECRGIALLELAATAKAAQETVKVLRASEPVRQAAEKNIERDFVFIPCYVAFLALLCATVARLAGALGWRRWSAALLGLASLQPVAGVLDGFENVGMFTMLIRGVVVENVHIWTLAVSTAKWWLVGFGFVAPVVAAPVLVVCEAVKCAIRRSEGSA